MSILLEVKNTTNHTPVFEVFFGQTDYNRVDFSGGLSGERHRG